MAHMEGQGQSRKSQGSPATQDLGNFVKYSKFQVFNFWAGPASWVPSLGTSWQARLVADCRPASPDLTDVLQPYALFFVFSSFVSRGWAASTLWLADWLGSLRPAMSHPCFRTRSLIGPRHSGRDLTVLVPTAEDAEGRGR